MGDPGTLSTSGGLAPTSPELSSSDARPYFLWWVDVTVGELRKKLAEGSTAERAYYLGALLREANTRDVWLFTTPDEIRELWPHLARHLGKTRQRWAWLLDVSDAVPNLDVIGSRA